MKAEINMVVKNAREATDFYQALFEVNVLSKTDLEGNVNEGMISSLYFFLSVTSIAIT